MGDLAYPRWPPRLFPGGGHVFPRGGTDPGAGGATDHPGMAYTEIHIALDALAAQSGTGRCGDETEPEPLAGQLFSGYPLVAVDLWRQYPVLLYGQPGCRHKTWTATLADGGNGTLIGAHPGR